MATVVCTLAFVGDNGDEEATTVLEIIERTNADLRARHKNASLVATQESSLLTLRVTTTAQTQEEAEALQEAFIAEAEDRLNSIPRRYKSGSVKSLILQLFTDNPGRDYTAPEVASEIGKKPHNISAVMTSLVQEGALKPTNKRPKRKSGGTAPMAYRRT